MILEGRTQSWAGVEGCNGMRGQLHNFDEISGEAFAWLGRTLVVTVAAVAGCGPEADIAACSN